MIYQWYTEVYVAEIHYFISDDLCPTVCCYEAGRDGKCTFTLPHYNNTQIILVNNTYAATQETNLAAVICTN